MIFSIFKVNLHITELGDDSHHLIMEVCMDGVVCGYKISGEENALKTQIIQTSRCSMKTHHLVCRLGHKCACRGLHDWNRGWGSAHCGGVGLPDKSYKKGSSGRGWRVLPYDNDMPVDPHTYNNNERPVAGRYATIRYSMYIVMVCENTSQRNLEYL